MSRGAGLGRASLLSQARPGCSTRALRIVTSQIVSISADGKLREQQQQFLVDFAKLFILFLTGFEVECPEVSEAMLKNTTSQMHTDGNMQIVALPDGESANHNKNYGSGTLVPAVGASGAIVEYKGGESAIKPLDDEDLEVKLRRISEQVPVRISNTSGSSAGSGSGDFHQYRQMRRREQDRVHRMEIDYQKRMAEREFHQRREERLREAEERTAKKRALRQKKKESKKLKKSRLGPAPAPAPTDGHLSSVQRQPLTNNTEENQPSDDNGDSDDGGNELAVEQERLGAPTTQLVAGGTS